MSEFRHTPLYTFYERSFRIRVIELRCVARNSHCSGAPAIGGHMCCDVDAWAFFRWQLLDPSSKRKFRYMYSGRSL